MPKDTKVLQSTDTHGGFHGDGDYFVVFQFAGNQYEEFLKSADKNSQWKDLPLKYDFHKFIFGEQKISGDSMVIYEGLGENKIPDNIKHGKYYFRDKFAEYYPEYKGTSILDSRRGADNFIFAILDSDSKKLYILEYDS